MPNNAPKQAPVDPSGEQRDRTTSSIEREQVQRKDSHSKEPSQDTDPDSPDADIDRDDMIDEP